MELYRYKKNKSLHELIKSAFQDILLKGKIFDLSLVENREFQRKLERNIVRDKTAKVRRV